MKIPEGHRCGDRTKETKVCQLEHAFYEFKVVLKGRTFEFDEKMAKNADSYSTLSVILI